jgi:hypothetical protein
MFASRTLSSVLRFAAASPTMRLPNAHCQRSLSRVVLVRPFAMKRMFATNPTINRELFNPDIPAANTSEPEKLGSIRSAANPQSTTNIANGEGCPVSPVKPATEQSSCGESEQRREEAPKPQTTAHPRTITLTIPNFNWQSTGGRAWEYYKRVFEEQANSKYSVSNGMENLALFSGILAGAWFSHWCFMDEYKVPIVLLGLAATFAGGVGAIAFGIGINYWAFVPPLLLLPLATVMLMRYIRFKHRYNSRL